MSIRSKSIPKKVYKFVYRQDISIQTNITGRTFENEWLLIAIDGKITVKGSHYKGYAWDGCSPKGNFIDLTWGTPDGRLDFSTERPITFFASMIHDVLYQYKNNVPISRKETDILFLITLQEATFKLTGLYYWAVRAFGGFYGSWAKVESQDDIKITNFSWKLNS